MSLKTCKINKLIKSILFINLFILVLSYIFLFIFKIPELKYYLRLSSYYCLSFYSIISIFKPSILIKNKNDFYLSRITGILLIIIIIYKIIDNY